MALTKAKKELMELMESLFESPENGVNLCISNKIKQPIEALSEKGSPKKLCFSPDKFVSCLRCVVRFPSEYIKISKNVSFDMAARKGTAKDTFKELLKPKRIEVFNSLIHGKGVKILEEVEAGEFIMEYLGEIISLEEASARNQELAHYDYPYQLSNETVLDAYYFGNESRFINHSCDPNCVSRLYYQDGVKHVGIFAIERIERNQELTFDYQLDESRFNEMRCNCKSKNCKKPASEK